MNMRAVWIFWLLVAVILHALLPRYQIVMLQPSAPDYAGGFARFDRWTGVLDTVGYTGHPPDWFTVNGQRVADFLRQSDPKAEEKGQQKK